MARETNQTSREKSPTSLSDEDTISGDAKSDLHREIRNNLSDDNKIGFLSERRLRTILTVPVLENELGKYDLLHRKKEKDLGHMRFHFSKVRAQRKADIHIEAQRIFGALEEGASGEITYLKIMAILILIERPARIKLFIDADISDRDLPLFECPKEKGTQRHGLCKKDSNVPLKLFDVWRRCSIERFEEHQWIFLTPFFESADRKSVPHYQFSQKQILPFKFSRKHDIREGGFGWVHMVEIPPDHHDFKQSNARNSYFAVKTLKGPRTLGAFKRELATLQRFSGNVHRHLISLLATYEKNDRYHLVFPWAEADLLHYWQRNERPDPSDLHETLMWMARQCQGLSDGLSYIHRLRTCSGTSLLSPDSLGLSSQPTNETPKGTQMAAKTPIHLFGQHGDIKPENILWFPYSEDPLDGEKGIFKITDFGFAEFSREEQVDIRTRRCIALSSTYCPPENELDVNFIRPSYDIWSLGCVFLHFMTWLLGGWELIKEFNKYRLERDIETQIWKGIFWKSDVFFIFFRNPETGEVEAKVKPSVHKFIKKLRLRPTSDRNNYYPGDKRFVRDFLHMIRKHMLIVEKREENLYRKSSTNIARALEDMRIETLGHQ
ncbi:putative Protein kinase [Seiridium cardinale]